MSSKGSTVLASSILEEATRCETLLYKNCGPRILSGWDSIASRVPKVPCPDCRRNIAFHELETKTVAQSNGFSTNYRCPFCRNVIRNVAELL